MQKGIEEFFSLFSKIDIYTPSNLIESLTNVAMRRDLEGQAKISNKYSVIKGGKLIEILFREKIIATENRLILIQSSNDLEFIISILFAYKNNLLPLLLSNQVTNCELQELKKRFQPGTLLVNGILFREEDTSPVAKIYEKDAVVILTSGSSGRPKSVVHSFESLFNAAHRSNKSLGLTLNDRWLLSLPLNHISGLSILFRSVAGNNSIVLTNSKNPSDTDFKNCLELKPSLVSFVPTQLKEFIDLASSIQYNFRSMLVGGSVVTNKLISDSIAKNLHITKVYGSSETAAFIAITSNEMLNENLDSGAFPLEGVSISSVEDELTIQTNQLFDRYFDDEILTHQKKQNGVYLTGDKAVINKDGSFSITGRKSRLIITGGVNVDPIEVEKEISDCPGIIEVFVFSVHNEKWGEAVSALLKTNDEFEIQDYHTYIKQKMAKYKIPKYYRIVDDIPKTTLGKPDLQKCREILLEK